MFPLIKISAASAVALAVFGLVATAQRTPTMDGSEAVESMQHAAEIMHINLSTECVRAIELSVATTGFEQGAVTAGGGVLIRDANGRDTWVCAAK
jgi:hypothetical protein